MKKTVIVTAIAYIIYYVIYGEFNKEIFPGIINRYLEEIHKWMILLY